MWVIAAADQEVQVVARTVNSGEVSVPGPASIMEAVGQFAADETGHSALVRRVAGGRTAGRTQFPVVVHGANVADSKSSKTVPVGGVVGGRVVGGEGGAVEVTDEVLAAGAAGDAAGVEVDDHHPLDVAGIAVHGEREEIGAFPPPPTAPAGPKSLRCVHFLRLA